MVESTRLENGRGLTPTVGSNPTVYPALKCYGSTDHSCWSSGGSTPPRARRGPVLRRRRRLAPGQEPLGASPPRWIHRRLVAAAGRAGDRLAGHYAGADLYVQDLSVTEAHLLYTQRAVVRLHQVLIGPGRVMELVDIAVSSAAGQLSMLVRVQPRLIP